MIGVQLSMKGRDAAEATLDSLTKELKRFEEQSPINTVEYVRKEIRTNAPNSSGELRRSVRVFRDSEHSWRVIIGGGLYRPYHIPQELGFQPHVVIQDWMHEPGQYGGERGSAMSGETIQHPMWVISKRATHKGYITRGFNQGLHKLDGDIQDFTNRIQ